MAVVNNPNLPQLPPNRPGSAVTVDTMDRQSAQQQRMARYLKLSLGLHVGLAALSLLGNLVFPSTAEVFLPSVQIDMVALPDLVKSQNQPILDKTLPVKDAPPPPEPPQKTAEKEPEPRDNAKDDRMSIEREKQAAIDAKKALERLRNQVKKTQAEEVERARRELLEKRQADLARFKEAYRSVVKGNQVNEGTSMTGVSAETRNAYIGMIQEKIRSNWALPAFLQGRGLTANAIVQLDGSGRVIGFRLTKSSGNETFDEYVTTAVQRSSPFAPPPEEMSRTLRNGFQVNFPL